MQVIFTKAPQTSDTYTLSLHDALPISVLDVLREEYVRTARAKGVREALVLGKHTLRNALIPIVTVAGIQLGQRSEEHTSELQSHSDLVCRLLLEKKKVLDELGDDLGNE